MIKIHDPSSNDQWQWLAGCTSFKNSTWQSYVGMNDTKVVMAGRTHRRNNKGGYRILSASPDLMSPDRRCSLHDATTLSKATAPMASWGFGGALIDLQVSE
jgi:hypothetical protein